MEADWTFSNKGSPGLPAGSDVATLRAAAAANVGKLLAVLPSLAQDVRRLVRVEYAASQKLPDDTTDDNVLALWEAHTLAAGVHCVCDAVCGCSVWCGLTHTQRIAVARARRMAQSCCTLCLHSNSSRHSCRRGRHHRPDGALRRTATTWPQAGHVRRSWTMTWPRSCSLKLTGGTTKTRTA